MCSTTRKSEAKSEFSRPNRIDKTRTKKNAEVEYRQRRYDAPHKHSLLASPHPCCNVAIRESSSLKYTPCACTIAFPCFPTPDQVTPRGLGQTPVMILLAWSLQRCDIPIAVRTVTFNVTYSFSVCRSQRKRTITKQPTTKTTAAATTINDERNEPTMTTNEQTNERTNDG